MVRRCSFDKKVSLNQSNQPIVDFAVLLLLLLDLGLTQTAPQHLALCLLQRGIGEEKHRRKTTTGLRNYPSGLRFHPRININISSAQFFFN